MMEPLTVSIGVGLVVSLLFTEVFGLAAGGMIVPGYFALHASEPMRVVTTFAAAIATFGIVRGISKFTIIYGRRRIVITILVGFLIGGLVRAVPAFAAETPNSAGLDVAPMAVIGFIIPGLIALWIDRQGMLQTLGALTTTSVIVRLVLIVIGLEVVA